MPLSERGFSAEADGLPHQPFRQTNNRIPQRQDVLFYLHFHLLQRTALRHAHKHRRSCAQKSAAVRTNTSVCVHNRGRYYTPLKYKYLEKQDVKPASNSPFFTFWSIFRQTAPPVLPPADGVSSHRQTGNPRSGTRMPSRHARKKKRNATSRVTPCGQHQAAQPALSPTRLRQPRPAKTAQCVWSSRRTLSPSSFSMRVFIFPPKGQG